MTGILRKYATPLCIAVFIGIGVSGCLMFFGVRNHDLVELHEKIGITFVVIALLHLFRNWKSFGILLRQKASPWIIGVVGLVALCLISAALITPGPGHGSPVRGQIMVAQRLAHQPLAKMASALDMSEAELALRLKAGGVTLEPGENTLSDVANKSGWQVGQLFGLLLNTPHTGKQTRGGNRNGHHGAH